MSIYYMNWLYQLIISIYYINICISRFHTSNWLVGFKTNLVQILLFATTEANNRKAEFWMEIFLMTSPNFIGLITIFLQKLVNFSTCS